MNISHSGLQHNLVLLLSYLQLIDCHTFFFSLSFVDDISYNSILNIYLWSPSAEDIESLLSESTADYDGINGLTLSMYVCVSVGVSHHSSLEDRYSHESFSFFLADNSFNTFVRQGVKFDTMEGRIYDEFLGLVELYIWIKEKIFSNFEIFLYVQLSLILMLIYREISVIRVSRVLLNFNNLLDILRNCMNKFACFEIEDSYDFVLEYY